jgi:hypothetical protein
MYGQQSPASVKQSPLDLGNAGTCLFDVVKRVLRDVRDARVGVFPHRAFLWDD